MPFGNDPVVGVAPSSGGFGKDPLANAPTAEATPQHGALYNALFKESSGGGSALTSADEGVLPALRDYSLAGLDDVTMGLGPKLLGLTGAAQQAQQNLGPMGYVTGAATYGLGPGKVLGPAGKAIGALSPVAKPVVSAAAEGALAGGGWSGMHGGDPVTGALTGAALGGAGSAVGAGIGKLAGFAAPPETQPWRFGANTDALENAKTASFQQGNEFKYAPRDVAPILDVNAAQLDEGLKPFVSGRLADTLANLKANVTAQQSGVTGNTLATYAQNLRSEFGRNPNVSNADQIVANQIADGLVGNPELQIPGVLGAATPISGQAPGQAAQWLNQANEAHRQFALAQGLQKAAQQIEDGTGNPAAWASQQLDHFYTNADPNYAPASNPGYAAQRAALVKIANAGGGYQSAWNLAHAGAPIAEGLGGLAGGWLGEMGAGVAYKLLAKPAFGKIMSANQKAAMQRAIAESYPALTGTDVPMPTPRAPSGATVGESLKNLGMGAVY